jgi:hypothetical protein
VSLVAGWALALLKTAEELGNRAQGKDEESEPNDAQTKWQRFLVNSFDWV